LKIAVLGTGSAGLHHLEALRELPGVGPIAVPVRPSRMEAMASKGYETAPGIAEAVSQGAESAIVATDTARHLEDSLAVISAGMDVLVEKPMGGDAGEARQICEQSAAMNRRVYVACVLRFSESLNLFRQMMDQVGSLHAVDIEARSYLPDWRPSRPYKDSYSAQADQGGVLRDLVHEIDYAGWLFGWPSSLQGRLRNLGVLGIQAEESANLTWETETGCYVSIGLDYLSRPAIRRIVARGDRGTLRWDGITGDVKLSANGNPPKEIGSTQTMRQMYSAQAQAFVAACRGDSDGSLATGEDGARALAVCDAARIASRDRKETAVNYP